jgi:hypothetical protein
MADLISDGFVSLLGGCNAGLAPTLLPATQFASGLNISCRDGLVRTRPSFSRLKVLVQGANNFQGAAVYRRTDADRVVFAADGIVHIYNLATDGLVTLAPGTPMSWDATSMYFAQADKYMVVQDGVNRPLIILDDALYRQAGPYTAYSPPAPGPEAGINDIFTGTITTYGHGRIFTVANHLHANDGLPDTSTDGTPFIVAGDIRDNLEPDSILEFTETLFLTGGGELSMPAASGPVQGLGFFRNVQSGTGQGPLIAFAKNGVSALNVNTDRDAEWQGAGFAQVLFNDIGTISPRSVVSLNDDLLFRAFDGLRSLRYTASQVGGGSGVLSATPISHEVEPWLDMDDVDDLPHVSIAVAENRMLLTSAGRDTTELGWPNGFHGLVCLDTAPAYGISGALVPPAYTGIWTGANWLQVLRGEVRNGKPTLLALGANDSNIELWALDVSGDLYRDNLDYKTLCRLYTRSFDFGNARTLKKFSHVDVWVQDLKGDAELTAYYRPEGYALWNTCEAVSLVADGENGQPQRRYRIRLTPTADDTYDPATGIHVGQGNNFQVCLEWEGSLALEKVVISVLPVTEEPGVCCPEAETAVALTPGAGGILLDDFTYSMV